jgi:hypothetical protein
MALHEVLAVNRDDVISRWKGQIQGALTLEAMPALELVDHIPQFVEEILADLRADANLLSLDSTTEEGKSAGRPRYTTASTWLQSRCGGAQIIRILSHSITRQACRPCFIEGTG